MDALVSAYLRLPRRLRAVVPAAFEDWAGARLLPHLRGAGSVTGIEARLWGGFSRPALGELEALVRAPATPPRAAAEAGLALARWHAVAEDFPAALAAITAARTRHPRFARERRQFLLEALFLCRLGRGAEARVLLAGRKPAGEAGFDVSLALMRANTWNPAAGAPDADPERAMAEINAVFGHFGLSPLARRDPAAPLGLDNLRGTAAPGSRAGPRVTVIVPFWNAAATIGTALAGLEGQSWENLEILAVDDASEDDGPGIVADLARADPRLRLIRQPVNRGSYAARNRALHEATGDFVTVHDADDWSHPERIARHVDDLARREAPFNISEWTRASHDLAFWGPWRPMTAQTVRNFASIFFRRDLIERTGAWDTARISADREFNNRVQVLHGLPRQTAFLPGCPLAFGRSSAASLTRAAASHAATMLHGIRREYHEASDFWHARLDPAAVRAQGLCTAPPFFPAPRAIRAERGPEPDHDLLVIGDFNFLGGTQKSALQMIAAARAAGLSTALLHYRRYDQDVTRPLNTPVRAMAAEAGVRIAAPGERLRARIVVVSYPPVFDHAMDRFPQVEHAHLVVVVNQMAARDRAGTDIAYDPARVRAHLTELLGSEGVWAPISPRVRALMQADPRYPPPHHDTWTPLIDTQTWCARTPVWRGEARARPVLGRHGRDHPLKWPRDRRALRAAYCAGRDCELRFLGGARHAAARLRRWPSNWRVEAFGARDVRGFLADLDVFLHFPDPEYIEEFGRAPMEAMAVGVPVILPPEFEPTFGEAALYTEPAGVWPLAQSLWRDREAWEARVAAGRAFVAAHCRHDAFPARLARLEAARSGPVEA